MDTIVFYISCSLLLLLALCMLFYMIFASRKMKNKRFQLRRKSFIAFFALLAVTVTANAHIVHNGQPEILATNAMCWEYITFVTFILLSIAHFGKDYYKNPYSWFMLLQYAVICVVGNIVGQALDLYKPLYNYADICHTDNFIGAFFVVREIMTIIIITCYIFMIIMLISSYLKYFRKKKEVSIEVRKRMNDEAVSVSPHPRISALLRMMRRHSKLLFTLLLLMGVFLFAGSVAAVFREINSQLEKDKIENALGHVFTETLHTAHSIDSQFRDIGAHMQLFTEELAFRMNTITPTLLVSDFYDYTAGRKPETAPPEFKYHPNYSTYVSFKTFMYKLAPNAKPENIQTVLNAINSMLPTYECYMQMHGKKNINHDFPILSLYTGFETGIHVSYPYNSDYKDEYDPRLRKWYTSAQMAKANTPTWTKPYINKGQVKQLVMTCSVSFKTVGGELIGVMGADVLPETLQDILHANTANKNFIISKYIVSKDGEICQDLSGRYSPIINNKEIEFCKFPDESLFSKMWSMRNGRLFANKSQTSIYTFVHLESIDMLYIEKLNFMKMKETF